MHFFSFRKSFWKTNKNNQRSRKKQVEALENLKYRETQLANTHDYEDILSIPKEREIFKNIYNNRLEKIKELKK